MPAAIFDLDDTLYPHVQYVHSGFAAVARFVDEQFGLSSAEAYATLRIARETEHRGREFQQLCAARGLDAALLPALVQAYRTHAPQLWLSHGARATLDDLRASGWSLAILTNGLPAVQARKVRALGLETLVDHVLYAAEHAPGGKPAREPFVEALRRLGVDPADTVMVGDDTVNDIDGARAVGIRTIHVHLGGRPHHAGADAVVRLLNDVPRVARQLAGQGVAHAA